MRFAATLKTAVACLVLVGTSALAQSGPSPSGLWRTIDDSTGKPKSLMRLTETNGVVSGRIEKILTEGVPQDKTCDQCTDDRKDKPLVGMVVLKGLKFDGEYWSGGEILDPNNGKTYRARAKLAEGGKALELRGYMGTPMLGRTQTWQRVE